MIRRLAAIALALCAVSGSVAAGEPLDSIPMGTGTAKTWIKPDFLESPRPLQPGDLLNEWPLQFSQGAFGDIDASASNAPQADSGNGQSPGSEGNNQRGKRYGIIRQPLRKGFLLLTLIAFLLGAGLTYFGTVVYDRWFGRSNVVANSQSQHRKKENPIDGASPNARRHEL